MKRILLPILVTGILLLSGCAPAPISEPPIPAHFITYTDEANLFSISYPADWERGPWAFEQFTKEVIESIEFDRPLERSGSLFIAALRTEIGLPTNVEIRVEPLPGVGWTLDEVVEASFQVEGFREFSRVKTTIGGREAVIADWEVTIVKWRFLIMTTLVGKTVWTVTVMSEAGKFDQSEDDFYAIVRSLRILK